MDNEIKGLDIADLALLNHVKLKELTKEGYKMDENITKQICTVNRLRDEIDKLNKKGDSVNHPSHYQGRDNIETITVIHNALTKDGFISYCLGNVLKYTNRYNKKIGVEGAEDLKKAKVYLIWAIEEEEGNFKIEQE